MKITEYKKKNGTIVYRANIYLGIDVVTGKKVKTSITGRTRKEVKQKTKEAQQAFKANGQTVTEILSLKTYKELANLWLESYQLTVKPQSFISAKGILSNYLLPAFGDVKLDKLSLPYIQSVINNMSSRLVNYAMVHSINKRILQYGVSLQLIPTNPARDVILPKVSREESKAIKFIDSNILKALMSYMENVSNQDYRYYFDYVMYSLLLATGCRFGEACALEWSDIDFCSNTININKSYNRNVRLVGDPKSKAGIRVISVDQKTINLLRLYKNRQRQLFAEVGNGSPKVVFSTPTKEYQDISTRQEALNKYLNAISCPRFTFHAFRHTHASLLLNAGISYKELQYRLGHAKLAMTMDTYSHLSKAKEKEAVSYYEKAINGL
ncbi:Phage integrase: site-specific recombinase [Streptococcus pyogenes]|uniref:tyrosine-type recombinase/integrase n=1 Tax=Streptococcus pyogenes TaxID=1314 RepID=UPI0010A0D3A0|nr:site-specific integrase [Streptococcus pyogenes]VGQ22023.1 Phage integrase: site-specific recombinase [Streptococcus pyogenes]